MIFVLAAVLAVVGAVLLYLDARRRRGSHLAETVEPPQPQQLDDALNAAEMQLPAAESG